MSKPVPFGFHTSIDRNTPKLYGLANDNVTVSTYTNHFLDINRELNYRFTSHFHPYVGALIKRLIDKQIAGLQDADTDYSKGTTQDADGRDRPTEFYEQIFSPFLYGPTAAVDMQHPPLRELEFSSSGAYSVYNWELFFHIPLAMGIQLMKNQRFEEAQKWLQYIFDPTDDSSGPTPQRFWKAWPLQRKDIATIEEILTNLSTGASDPSNAVDPVLFAETIQEITEWTANPFSPHVVARLRQTPYMYKALMAYLDNLIAWGDSLFREDTGESVNEATQLYVLAANILGPRPQKVPAKGTVGTLTYGQLRGVPLDAFSNALVDLESEIPFEIGPTPKNAVPVDPLSAVRSVGKVLYFCVPRNDKLLAYWDTVADRLFKIHNSLNLQGIFRQLPLFEPPIDPALLARAVASGLDVGAVAAGLNQPLPLVRCQMLLQRASEICQEVKSLGGQLLATLEKGDGEALAILRARQERQMLELGESIKYAQLQEAGKAREGIEKSLASAGSRYFYYEQLLGKTFAQINIPTLDSVDNESLTKMSFSASEPVVNPREIVIDIDPAGSALAEGNQLSHHETTEMNKLSSAQDSQSSATTMEITASAMNVIPSFSVNLEPFGIGASISFGGSNIAAIFSGLAASDRGDAGQSTYEANRAAKIGSYARRTQDWTFQSNLAAAEITQLFKQLRAAQIREAIAQREWENHQQQIENARDIEQFLSDDRVGKTTNEGFYVWMKGEVKGLYARSFQLAFDVGKKAERALQHELGDSSLGFIGFDYLAGKEGLLAGEKLFLDVKRMEVAYHDLNLREYELTKHCSLLEIDPAALLQLRASGTCVVTLSDQVFDLDGAGHYFRRLKSVAVSLPCVAGPYTSVPCTMTLLRSSVRTSPLVGTDGYGRTGSDDPRFSDYFGSLQSIVTSSAQNDAGLFETNLHDERYLPFEGSGAVSQWQLTLPSDFRGFDYDTISDVVIHVRYTAREGGVPLRNAAVTALGGLITGGQAPGSVSLISVRHEFPTEWADFKNANTATGRAALTLKLSEQNYPFWGAGRLNQLLEMHVFSSAVANDVSLTEKIDGTGGKTTLQKAPPYGALRWGAHGTLPLPLPTGTLQMFADTNAMDNLWIALTWGG
jgi:hypothetical protein